MNRPPMIVQMMKPITLDMPNTPLSLVINGQADQGTENKKGAPKNPLCLSYAQTAYSASTRSAVSFSWYVPSHILRLAAM